MLKKFSEFSKSNFPIPISVELLHQGLRLLLVHLGAQLPELPYGDVATMVPVYRLEAEYSEQGL